MSRQGLAARCRARPGRQELQPECCGSGRVGLADDALGNNAVNLNAPGRTRLVSGP